MNFDSMFRKMSPQYYPKKIFVSLISSKAASPKPVPVLLVSPNVINFSGGK
jgi:hypothetical protein